MLAGRLADTAPFGWTGAANTVREHLAQTLARLGGTGLDDKSLYALLTYLARMARPPSLSAQDARVLNGKRIFESYDVGCSGCHDPEHGFTDGERHNVGSGTRDDRLRSFETPSLRYVGGTAPYFHDGRFATLEDLLRNSPQMADAARLSDGEIADLAAFLRTL
jgi:cytochrome c peroxidase